MKYYLIQYPMGCRYLTLKTMDGEVLHVNYSPKRIGPFNSKEDASGWLAKNYQRHHTYNLEEQENPYVS